jgi:hypothetical protein
VRKLLVLTLLLLTSCGRGSTGEDVRVRVDEKIDATFSYFRLPLPDGRVLECVTRQGKYQGGLSCNWAEPI